VLALMPALAAVAAMGPTASAQVVFQSPFPVPGAGPVAVRTRAPAQDDGARQVTLFGVIAAPGAAIDPRLANVAPQLRKLLPGHSFRLLDVQSKRLTAGQTLSCNLQGPFTASTMLLHPLDENGKVRLRCVVMQGGVAQLQTDVSTPPNQLFFCEQPLGGGQRLLIGVGAR
jgi:hypothetical protein